GAKILREDVGARDQPHRSVEPGRRLQIEDYRALVAIVVEKRCRKPAAEVGAGASMVAAFRRLHLDDVGTLVGKDHRRERPGDIRRKIDDAIPVQRTRHEMTFLVKSRHYLLAEEA